jgi:hypothetical protein
MNETLRWTYLKGHEIARLLGYEGIEVSVTVVDYVDYVVDYVDYIVEETQFS